MEVFSSGISGLRSAMEAGELSSRGLVLRYLERIARLDSREGGLNSIIELNPDALNEADKLDEARRNGRILGSLHGIPVLLKDNICSRGKMRTSAGSLALAGNYAPYDAEITRRLRGAGAVILGKTNMTEFANYMTENMPNGYSSRGGRTLNPYDKNADPSGSSTGSAVAVSAGLCAAAVGTETYGSIVSPAQHCGIVGIKPTLGLISQAGIIPVSYTLDTAGPMARNVAGAAELLGALAGIDYMAHLKAGGLQGAKIGICRMFTEEMTDEEREISEGVITVLRDSGVVCVELPPHGIGANDLSTIMRYEFKSGINAFLSGMGPNVPKSLLEIIQFNQQNARAALKYGQSELVDAQNGTSGNMTEPEYLEALVSRESKIEGLDRLFTDNNIEIIYMASGGSGLAVLAGFPAMTIPVGIKKNGLPVGSYWVARRYGEAAILRVTYALEQCLGCIVPPDLEVV